jgi:hypothetical protein
MRGPDDKQDWMFSYISADKRVPKDHPLRTVRTLADTVLKELSPLFESLYAKLAVLRLPLRGSFEPCCFRCCTRSAASDCSWSNSTTTFCSAGLSV